MELGSLVVSVFPPHPQTPSCAPSPPCWSSLTTWSSVWLPAGTTLVLPLEWRTTFWRTSRPLRGARWRPAALTCSSDGSEGSGPQEGRSVAGLLCWEQFKSASDRRQLQALLEHCSQHSELCYVPMCLLWTPAPTLLSPPVVFTEGVWCV